MVGKFRKKIEGIKINRERFSDKQLKHIAEHIDDAMVSLAFAANLFVEILKHQSRQKRKTDKKM